MGLEMRIVTDPPNFASNIGGTGLWPVIAWFSKLRRPDRIQSGVEMVTAKNTEGFLTKTVPKFSTSHDLIERVELRFHDT